MAIAQRSTTAQSQTLDRVTGGDAGPRGQDEVPTGTCTPRAQRGIGYGDTPLGVRTDAINVAATVPGVPLAWHQTCVGDWRALATFEITNRSGKSTIVVTQLARATAVSPRQE